ncbi:MAG TPA: hypothetical protein VE439_10185, partial [Anaerolineae bacterium]|nr:hypothetical protein [Anaerolineae bacterium]
MLLRAILVLMLGLIAAVPSPAFADDGYAGGVGQAPVPRNSKDIVMESEVVNIVLHEGFAEVECAYKFRNDGNDQTVIMGFPDPTDPAKDLGISIFRVLVDNIEVPVKETTIALKPDQPGFEQYGPISRWYLHDISFKKDETKVVVNRYVAPHGVSASPETASFRHFSYILRTGATWKGVIGRAVINVSFASGLSWSNFKPDPESYKETGGAPSSDLYI